MKRIKKLTLALAVILTAITSCQQKAKKETDKAQFILNGTIEGMESGVVKIVDKKTYKDYSANVVNGKFTLKGDFPEPTFIYLLEENTGNLGVAYAENTTFTLTANVNDLKNTKIVGGPTHMDMLKVEELRKPLMNDPIVSKAFMDKMNPDTSKERQAEIGQILKEHENRINALHLEFIKNNPKSYYSAYLVMNQCAGASVAEKEKLIALLDQSLYNETYIKKIRELLVEFKNTESSFEEFVNNAPNVTYKLDKQFKGKALKDVIYLGVFQNNNICALTKDGKVQTITPEGVKLAEFKTELKGKASSLAIDEDDNIYVMDVLVEVVKKKNRGRVMEFTNPIGVECIVFNSKGEKQKRFTCSDIVSASGAKVVDAKLLLSDCRQGLIGIYDSKSGKLLSKINGMRPCCGILDFAVNANKELVVANLGAFKVQSYDLSGKGLKSYGKRGRELTAFHGCCNPVSVTSLKSGAIVTVEKDPTQLKIFSREGAKLIQGIDELVKGCAYIPMIVDGKENLYLASREKGIVKCVAI
jgi:hypothetical protein